MKIGFLMYPWGRMIAARDTSLRLVHECARRGFEVSLFEPEGLAVDRGRVLGLGQRLVPAAVPARATSFHRAARFTPGTIPLGELDLLLVRLAPPADDALLDLLELFEASGVATRVINTARGLRRANSKLYSSGLTPELRPYLPATRVARDAETLLGWIAESPADLQILKPLHGYGGHGVVLLDRRAPGGCRALVEVCLGDPPRWLVLQEYLPGATAGDLRILLLDGAPIGAMRRVPRADDHRANLDSGGHAERHRLTPAERDLCRTIGPQLVADGLVFAGLDLIDGRLIEVNGLSPGGIVQMNRLYGEHLERRVIDGWVRRREI